MEREIAKVEQRNLSSAVWHGKEAVALGLSGEACRANFARTLNLSRNSKG